MTRLGLLMVSSAWLVTGACVSDDESPGTTGGTGGTGGMAGSGGSTTSGGGTGGGAGAGGGGTTGGAGTTGKAGAGGAGAGGAGTGGSAGSTGGSAGTTGGSAGTTGGSAGKADAGTDTGPPVMCPPPTPLTLCTPATPVANPLVSDFAAEGGAPIVFGAYAAPIWGGVYVYPSTIPEACSDAGPAMFPLTSDLSAGNWHISGTVGTYSGFGLWWNCTSGGKDHGVCTIDASAYSGIQFSIRGDAGPVGTVGLAISTVDDSAVSADVTKPSCGTCTAAMCTSPSVNVPVSATGATVTLRWSDFAGGVPSALDPSKITAMAFTLPFGGTGTNAADVTIDDIRFVSLGDAAPPTPDAPATDAPSADTGRDASAD
ncbi:MAG TPA: hypothetical protein VK540_04405 [Polyangiaceae bacterium]|nr:hypothetical protein [Polyangiaceae bacterium]